MLAFCSGKFEYQEGTASKLMANLTSSLFVCFYLGLWFIFCKLQMFCFVSTLGHTFFPWFNLVLSMS